MLKIACVLRSGGDFDWEYIIKLYENISGNTEHEFEFVVFSDIKQFVMPSNVRVIPLENENLKLYWSKLEVFNLTGQVLYFDLDVITVHNIDTMIDAIQKLSQDEFIMLEAFGIQHLHNSSIMAWNGDHRYLLEGITRETLDVYGKWDQDYISDMIMLNGVEIKSVNDYINIASYKKHCVNGVHPIVDIVVFHGKPRPAEIGWFMGGIQY